MFTKAQIRHRLKVVLEVHAFASLSGLLLQLQLLRKRFLLQEEVVLVAVLDRFEHRFLKQSRVVQFGQKRDPYHVVLRYRSDVEEMLLDLPPGHLRDYEASVAASIRVLAVQVELVRLERRQKRVRVLDDVAQFAGALGTEKRRAGSHNGVDLKKPSQ